MGDYFVPNLALSENVKDFRIGKYGRLRLKYLKENKKAEYIILNMNGELKKHLMEVDKLAKERVEFLIKQQAERQNVDEKLKENDQLKWVGMMNNIKDSAEEIVINELIFDEKVGGTMEKNELFDIDSVDLYECINGIKFKLQSRNFEYKKLQNQVENMKERVPKIRDILEDEEPSELTIEESSMLIKVVNLYREILRIEEYEIFFLGGGQAYKYFRKMEIIE